MRSFYYILVLRYFRDVLLGDFYRFLGIVEI